MATLAAPAPVFTRTLAVSFARRPSCKYERYVPPSPPSATFSLPFRSQSDPSPAASTAPPASANWPLRSLLRTSCFALPTVTITHSLATSPCLSLLVSRLYAAELKHFISPCLGISPLLRATRLTSCRIPPCSAFPNISRPTTVFISPPTVSLAPKTVSQHQNCITNCIHYHHPLYHPSHLPVSLALLKDRFLSATPLPVSVKRFHVPCFRDSFRFGLLSCQYFVVSFSLSCSCLLSGLVLLCYSTPACRSSLSTIRTSSSLSSLDQDFRFLDRHRRALHPSREPILVFPAANDRRPRPPCAMLCRLDSCSWRNSKWLSGFYTTAYASVAPQIKRGNALVSMESSPEQTKDRNRRQPIAHTDRRTSRPDRRAVFSAPFAIANTYSSGM
ncbi:hypothetical protein C8R47DRAFT_1324213 [Mycena vitilis]|nr:hypothetical protein C8R47DRAFT_1324213 [Mycena vitilis]